MSEFHHSDPVGSIRRRTFLADFGLGFTGLALGAMLAQDGILKASEPVKDELKTKLGQVLEASSDQRVGRAKPR